MTARPELDRMATAEVVDAVLAAEARVLPAVRAAAASIAAAADVLARQWEARGRWVFAGAGTSGRIAWLEAAELPGTFGLDSGRVPTLLAGGYEASDGDEDDTGAAESDARTTAFTERDALIAVAASGSTPYTVRVAEAAREAGAQTVAVVCAAGSVLARTATAAVELDVGAEVLRGSTRLGAGSAQKLALDALTTAAAARLGRVHGDHMIDVVGANEKLRERVAGIVADIVGAPIEHARAAVESCAGDARAAVLVLARGLSPAEAQARARRFRTLRGALEQP